MAQYLILIYENEAAYGDNPEVWQQVGEAHARFAQQVPEGEELGNAAQMPLATHSGVGQQRLDLRGPQQASTEFGIVK